MGTPGCSMGGDVVGDAGWEGTKGADWLCVPSSDE